MRSIDRVGIAAPFAGVVRRAPSFSMPTTLTQATFALTTSVNMTSDASAHTKGAYVEVIASTGGEVDRLLILSGASSSSTVNSSALMDIAVGAAGSEVVVIPDVFIGYAPAALWWDIPIAIPSGARISARYQSARTSTNCAIQVVALKRSNEAIQRPASYTVSIGTDTSTSQGVTLTSGAGSKGAYAELTSSCPVSLQGVQIGIGQASSTNASSGTIRVDIAVGAAGSETVIIPDVQALGANTENIARNINAPFFWPVRIPHGARIAARASNSAGSGAAYNVDVSLVGIPRSAP